VNDDLACQLETRRPLQVRGRDYSIWRDGCRLANFHTITGAETACSLRRHPAIQQSARFAAEFSSVCRESSGVNSLNRFSLSSVHPPGGGRTSSDAGRDVSGA
jgi:hypothetical protein